MVRTVRHMPVLLVLAAALAFVGSVPASGGRTVLQQRDPVISPDGRLIAYTSFSGTSKHGLLIVMRRDGTHARMLASARAGKPWWSPDGKLIAYLDRDVYVVSPTGGRSHRLSHEYSANGGPTEGLSITGWIDARTIGYDVNDCCIVGGVSYWWSASVTLGGEQVDHDSDSEIMCNISVTCDDAPPVVSADGTRTVTATKGADGAPRLTLAGAGLDPVDLGAGTSAIWAPGDAHFAWWNPDYTWTVADRNGQNRHVLQMPPAWSPDGARIAFTAKVAGHVQIWLAGGDGSNPSPLTTEPNGIADDLTLGWLWSTHGHWLVYDRLAGHVVETVVVRPDGTRAHVLVRWQTPFKDRYSWDDSWSSATWGPGDATAVYDDHVACGGTAVFRVNAITSQATRLTNPCRSKR